MENLNQLITHNKLTYDYNQYQNLIPSNWPDHTITNNTTTDLFSSNQPNNIATINYSSSASLLDNIIGREVAILLQQGEENQRRDVNVNVNDGHDDGDDGDDDDDDDEELGAMKEMMYKVAAMQPVDIDPATIRKPKRRNVRISDDPQSVAARHRRERISERIRILQRLVPGGTKMDTASMLDEAIRYVKFLKRQIRLLQQQSNNYNSNSHNHNLHSYFPQLVGSGLIFNSAPSSNYWSGFSAPNNQATN